MGILLKVVALSMAVCAAAMAQIPVIKPQIPDQDLSNNPLLTPRPLPTPRVPNLTRIGVAGGGPPFFLHQANFLPPQKNKHNPGSRRKIPPAPTTLRSPPSLARPH